MQWIPVERPPWQKWENVGDFIHGEVRWFEPRDGELDYNKERCGFLDLRTSTGKIVRVVLDKPNLLEQLWMAHPRPGTMLAIKYTEDGRSKNGKTYKKFEVKVGVG